MKDGECTTEQDDIESAIEIWKKNGSEKKNRNMLDHNQNRIN